MATAPTPGSFAAETEVRKYLRVRVKDLWLDVVPSPSLDEAFVIRNSTGGISFEALMSNFGMDTVFVLWWLGCRQNGEPNLAFADGKKRFPHPLSEDDWDLDDVDLDEGDTDNPESSGPDSNQPGPTSPTTSASAPGTSDA